MKVHGNLFFVLILCQFFFKKIVDGSSGCPLFQFPYSCTDILMYLSSLTCACLCFDIILFGTDKIFLDHHCGSFIFKKVDSMLILMGMGFLIMYRCACDIWHLHIDVWMFVDSFHMLMVLPNLSMNSATSFQINISLNMFF